LGTLLTLVQAYEGKHYPLDLPDPAEAIKFRMEQKGMTPKDLVPMIGRINRVYEVLEPQAPADACHDPAVASRTRHPCGVADQAARKAEGGVMRKPSKASN